MPKPANWTGVPQAIPQTPPNNAYVQRTQYELSVINGTSTFPPDNQKGQHDKDLLAGWKTAYQNLIAP